MSTECKIWDKISNIPTARGMISAELFLSKNPKAAFQDIVLVAKNGIVSQFVYVYELVKKYHLENPTKETVLAAFENDLFSNQLKDLKNEKNSLIDEMDKANSVFYIIHNDLKASMWIDKETRNSLLNVTLPALLSQGETVTKLWSNTDPPISFNISIDMLMSVIPRIELFAKTVYDNTQRLKSEVHSKKSIEEVENIVIDGYPDVLEFHLNQLEK